MVSTLTYCLAEAVMLLVYKTRGISSFKSFRNFHCDNKVIIAQHHVVKPKILLILKQPQHISTWLSQPHGLIIKHLKPPTVRINFANFACHVIQKVVFTTTKDHISTLLKSYHLIFVSIPLWHVFIGPICFWAIYPQAPLVVTISFAALHLYPMRVNTVNTEACRVEKIAF